MSAHYSIIWSTSASHEYVTLLTTLAETDKREAKRIATAIEKAIDSLGTSPTGHSGRIMGTYESPVPDTAYMVVYSMLPNRQIAILRVALGG